MNPPLPSLPAAVATHSLLAQAYDRATAADQRKEELNARHASLSAEVEALQATVKVDDTEQFRGLLGKRLQLELIERDLATATAELAEALPALKQALLSFRHAVRPVPGEVQAATRSERSRITALALVPYAKEMGSVNARESATHTLASTIADRDYHPDGTAELFKNSGILMEAWNAFAQVNTPSQEARP